MATNSVYMVRPLSNFAIERKLRRLTTKFKGVFDADSLPQRRYAYPWAIIVNTNTDRIDETGHWTAFVFDINGQGHYFDSYGDVPPHSSWISYLKAKSRYRVWTQSYLEVQRPNTNTCGYLCIDYVIRRLKNTRISDDRIVAGLNEMKAYRKYHSG